MKPCKHNRFLNMTAMLFLGAVRNYSFKTWTLIFALLIIVISTALFYRALSYSMSMNSHNRRSMLSLDKKSPQRLQSKYKDIIFRDGYQEFRKDLMLANVLPKSLPQNKSIITPENVKNLRRFLSRLYLIDYVNEDIDEVVYELKYLFIDCGLESDMACKEIDSLNVGGPIVKIQSKYIQYANIVPATVNSNVQASYGSMPDRPIFEVADLIVKSSFIDSSILQSCIDLMVDINECTAKRNYGLLREILLFNTLQHPSILLLKGYCLRGGRISKVMRNKGLLLVTEAGTTLCLSLFRACTWQQKISMALQVTKLLLYLDNSTFGSLRFTQLSLSDFVLVRGTIVKLAELDGLELGDLSCTKSSDCDLSGMRKGNFCQNGFCEGQNPSINLYYVITYIFKAMLTDAPDQDEAAFVSRLDSLNFTTKELMIALQVLFNKHPPEGPVYYVEPNRFDKRRKESMEKGEHYYVEDDSVVVSNFVRHGHRNFPGLYDYPCPGSKVSWGCVFIVNSLQEAAKLCLGDMTCQCFVVFSSSPETEKSLTIVLKNSTDSDPLVFSITTLFIRSPKENTLIGEAVNSKKKKDVDGVTSPQESSSAVQTCVKEMVRIQESDRHSREKRLMAHLRFKGIREQTWLKWARIQNMTDVEDLSKADGKGGQFIVNLPDYLPDGTNNIATQALFLSKDGPQVDHLAYAVAYQLDRILGLYHTPPCVSRELSAETVQLYSKNLAWDEVFNPLINSSDGTLPGLLVVPVHKYVKNTRLTLQPLRDMVSELEPFDEIKKFQLEYLLLLWLSGTEIISGDLGYKYHFIYFAADQAFNSKDVDMSNYLNHCQFSRNVYDSLKCFRCTPSVMSKGVQSNVCYLGEEVIKATQAMLPNGTEIILHGLKEEDIAAEIDAVASSILHIVDGCIKMFEHDVLY